jgi:hypothetical protein
VGGAKGEEEGNRKQGEARYEEREEGRYGESSAGEEKKEV